MNVKTWTKIDQSRASTAMVFFEDRRKRGAKRWKKWKFAPTLRAGSLLLRHNPRPSLSPSMDWVLVSLSFFSSRSTDIHARFSASLFLSSFSHRVRHVGSKFLLQDVFLYARFLLLHNLLRIGTFSYCVINFISKLSIVVFIIKKITENIARIKIIIVAKWYNSHFSCRKNDLCCGHFNIVNV